MKKYSIFFGKLPLCGKYGIRGCLEDVFNSRNHKDRVKSLFAYYGLLLLYIAGHITQAYFGCRLMFAPVRDPLIFFTGFCYVTLNLGAIVEHIYLGLRVAAFAIQHRRRYHLASRHELNRDSRREVFFATILTCLGQGAFLYLSLESSGLFL